MTGPIVLAAAVIVSLAVAAAYSLVNGRFRQTPDENRLTAVDIGSPLGEHVTLVQFSSAFCSPCRATRQLLTSVTYQHPGVTHVEIDAESHLDLVRRLNILRTPTVVVLDSSGAIRHRASGLPTRHQVEAVLSGVATHSVRAH